jgi:hypothetical protein
MGVGVGDGLEAGAGLAGRAGLDLSADLDGGVGVCASAARANEASRTGRILFTARDYASKCAGRQAGGEW